MYSVALLVLFTVTPYIFGTPSVYDVDVSRFASKTAYVESSTDSERQGGRATVDTIHYYCTPLQVTSVLRHGTRNPGDKDINRINKVLKKFQQASLSQSVAADLASVVEKFPLDTEGKLVEAGAKEHRDIGSRVSQVFSKLFRDADKKRISFSSTSKSRAEKSSEAFQSGFNSQAALNNTYRDDVLRFYDNCKEYNDHQDNPVSTLEYKKYVNNTFKSISQRYAMNLEIPSVDITTDEMASIFQISAVEFAALGRSAWGKYIHSEDLMKLEYAEDLESYYESGYGFPVNFEMSCPLLSEVFHGMDKVQQNKEYLLGNFYFAHSETVIPLMGLLGLYKDPTPLKADNYNQMHNRSYRASRNGPFATNVFFVQYDCDVIKINQNRPSIPQGIFPENVEQKMTLLLVKEQPVKYPFCSEFLCPYHTVRDHYSRFIDDCSFDELCKNSAQKLCGLKSFLFVLFSVVVVILLSML